MVGGVYDDDDDDGDGDDDGDVDPYTSEGLCISWMRPRDFSMSCNVGLAFHADLSSAR
jgi:hypothetical protein